MDEGVLVLPVVVSLIGQGHPSLCKDDPPPLLYLEAPKSKIMVPDISEDSTSLHPTFLPGGWKSRLPNRPTPPRITSISEFKTSIVYSHLNYVLNLIGEASGKFFCRKWPPLSMWMSVWRVRGRSSTGRSFIKTVSKQREARLGGEEGKSNSLVLVMLKLVTQTQDI